MLLDNNIGGRVVMLRPFRLQCVEVLISAGLLVYTYAIDHVCVCVYIYTPDLCKIRLLPGLPEHNYCVNQGVSSLKFPISVHLVNFMVKFYNFCKGRILYPEYP